MYEFRDTLYYSIGNIKEFKFQPIATYKLFESLTVNLQDKSS